MNRRTLERNSASLETIGVLVLKAPIWVYHFYNLRPAAGQAPGGMGGRRPRRQPCYLPEPVIA